MKIKICGLNITRDVQLCIDLKVNYLGFVFYKKSPRNINESDIKVLSTYDKKKSNFVAVTVDPSDEFIKKNLIGVFDFIQLHGSETKKRVTEIKNMGLKIIKAIKVKKIFDRKKISTGVLPIATRWHYAGYWHHIWKENKIFKNYLKKDYWKNASSLLQRSVSFPISIIGDRKSFKKRAEIISKIITDSH